MCKIELSFAQYRISILSFYILPLCLHAERSVTDISIYEPLEEDGVFENPVTSPSVFLFPRKLPPSQPLLCPVTYESPSLNCQPPLLQHGIVYPHSSSSPPFLNPERLLLEKNDPREDCLRVNRLPPYLLCEEPLSVRQPFSQPVEANSPFQGELATFSPKRIWRVFAVRLPYLLLFLSMIVANPPPPFFLI